MLFDVFVGYAEVKLPRTVILFFYNVVIEPARILIDFLSYKRHEIAYSILVRKILKINAYQFLQG